MKRASKPGFVRESVGVNTIKESVARWESSRQAALIVSMLRDLRNGSTAIGRPALDRMLSEAIHHVGQAHLTYQSLGE